MNKLEFLEAIRARIVSCLPEAEVAKTLDYYAEMIDDRMEENLSEQEAVAEMGTMDEIVAQILLDAPLSVLVKESVKPNRSLRVWEMILLILGFPIWGSLLLTGVCILLALLLTLGSVLISLYAILVSLWAGSLGCILLTFIQLFTREYLLSMTTCGAGLFLAGISIPTFFGCNAAARGCFRLCRSLLRSVKKLFVRRK